jgi:hypothetical protein
MGPLPSPLYRMVTKRKKPEQEENRENDVG